MADNATLGGIGSGLLNFADSYNKAKQQGIENDRNQQYADAYKQTQQEGLLKNGMQVDPATKQVSYTPEMQAQRQNTMQAASDEFDPNSDISKTSEQLARDRMEKVYPGSGAHVPAGKNANFYKTAYGDFLPEQEKLQGAQKVAGIKAQSASDVQDSKNEGALDRVGSKSTNDQNKAYSEMVGKVNSFRGNKAAANAADALRNVGNAQELLKRYPNLNDMPQAQVNLLTDELAKIAGGGAATEGGKKELNTSTFESNLNNFLGRAEGKPKPADLGNFLKENVGYLGGLQSANQKIVNDYKREMYEGYEPRLSDAHKGRFKSAHPELFADEKQMSGPAQQQSGPSSASSGSHPKDDAMLSWAKSNPNAPGAADVLRANGISSTAGR